jgi:hypothetical protein
VIDWVIGIYAAIMLALIALSGCIALCMRESDRRKDAYRVLRLLILSGAASGGLLGVLIKLHELGLLRW